MPVKQIKLPPDSVRADLCLGLTVTGLYTLTTMGLIIALCRGCDAKHTGAGGSAHALTQRAGTFPQRAR